MSQTISAPDLTQRAPRSIRARLGGYIILPRMLDKGRATIAGKNGEFHYNCPLDKHFIDYVGIDTDALKTELATGKGDGEILEWINAHAKNKHTPWEIEQWSQYGLARTPDSDAETRGYFNNMLDKISTTREDIRSWADLLDLDDYVTYGGKA